MLLKVSITKCPYEFPVTSWTTDYQSVSAAVRHCISYFRLSVLSDKRFPQSINVRIKMVSSDILCYDYHYLFVQKKNCIRKTPHVYPTSPHINDRQ